MDKKIIDSINYHANKLTRAYRLNRHDTEDVKQDLTLAALMAEQTYDPDKATSLTTFLKLVIEREAIDIGRKLSNQPIIENFEGDVNTQAVADFHYNRQRTAQITDEANSVDEKNIKKIKLSGISMGGELKHVSEAKPQPDPGIAMDVQAVLETLSPRQQTICNMLMEGAKQSKIAKSLKLSQPYINRQIKALRSYFATSDNFIKSLDFLVIKTHAFTNRNNRSTPFSKPKSTANNCNHFYSPSLRRHATCRRTRVTSLTTESTGIKQRSHFKLADGLRYRIAN